MMPPLFWVTRKKTLYFLKLSPELLFPFYIPSTLAFHSNTLLIPIAHPFLCTHFSLQCCQEAMLIYFNFFVIIPPWLILLIIKMFRMTSFLVSAERHNQIQLIGEISSLLDWQNIAILKFKFCLPIRIHSTRDKKYISECIQLTVILHTELSESALMSEK